MKNRLKSRPLLQEMMTKKINKKAISPASQLYLLMKSTPVKDYGKRRSIELYLALPFFTLEQSSNPALDQNMFMLLTILILWVVSSILFLYFRSRRLRNK
jgi:hypothetical protein